MTKFYTNFDIRKTLKFEKVLKHLLTTLLLFFILLANTAQVSAQIAQRGAATTASSTGNTIAINKPTGVVPGDIMIATIAQRASTGNTLGHAVLAGWTQIASSNLGANTTWGTVLYRIAAIGEPVNYTFTLDNQNNGATGAIIAFSGVDNVNPLDVTPNTLNVNTNTVASAATKTTTTTNAAVVMLVMSSLDAPTFNNNWNTATSPGALTELFDAQNTSARSAVGGAWALKPTIGATGTGTVTMSSNERYGAVILLLRKALPIITSFTATSACAGSGASITINGHHFSGATSVAFNGTAATYFINSSNQITATLPAGATSGTITVTTPAGTGTSATSFTVNALPVVAALTGNTNVCVNSSTAFSSTTPGGVWTSSSNAIATVVGGTVTGVSAGTATISYAVTTSGCTTTVTKTITVDALPTVSGPSSVCMGSTIQMMPNTGGTWSSSNNAFATIDNTGLVTPVAPGSVTFTFTNSTTNCSRTTSSVAINVAPSISFHPSSQVRCSGPATTVSFSVTAGGTGITYLWYKDGNPMSNGGNISGATTQTLTISPIAIGDAANYHCVVTGVCSPAAASNVATLSVNERIVITSQPATTQTHCSGGTATFAVTATGTTPTFQWYKNGSPLSDIGNILGSSTATLTISPLVSGDASANYYCIVSGVGSCSPVTSNNAALVINEGPAISAEPAATQTVCAGATVSFTVGATGGNLVYQWYKGASPLSNGPLISGVSTQTLTISNTVPSDSAPDYYCVVSNGCATPATTINAQLIVNDRPFIQNYTTAVCSTATFSVTPVNGVPTVGTVVPTGTTYTWGVPSMAPGLTGGMAGTNQSVISGTLVNSTNGDLTAVYTVTPTSGTAGNCTGNTFTVTVTVNPMPFVINSTASTCSGIPLSYTPSNGGGNIVPVGTTYSWSSPTVSGGMTGGASGTNQTAIHVNLNNPTNTVQTASYNVTATSGTCVGSTFTLVVNINPRPTAAGDIPTQSICSGAAISTITISNPNNVAGTIYYSWTRDNTVNVTGIAASGSTSTISGNLTNITNAPQTVTFQLYATSDQSCVSVGVPVTVVINPVPTVVATPSTQTICSGVNTTAVNFTSNGIAGTTTFIWSRDKNAEVTGLLPNGNGPIAATALTNTTNVQQIITFTVYATNSGCDSPTSTFTITVNPRPDISAIPTGQTLCGGSPFAQIDASNPNGVAGTTFSWTRNNTVNLTGYANSGTGATIPAGTFQNNTNVDQTATFTITATAAGCAITTTATVLVHPTPLAVATPASQNRCNGVAIANINLSTTNNMSNITYTWTRDKITELTGIANSGSGSIASGSSPIITGALTNTTSITQTATFTIVVTGPAPNFCSRTITATVTVYAPFIAPIIGDTQTACEFSTPAALTMTTLPTGGSGVFTYQWQRSANGTTGWANIGGATGVTYTPGFVTQTWYYRLIITDTAGCAPSPITTNSVLIQMASSSGLTFNASGFPNAAICPGTSFTPSLSAVHGDDAAIRFTWSANSTYITPGTGGPIGTTGNRFWILVWLRTSTGNFNFTAQNNTNASVTVPITITPHLYDYDGSNLGAFQCTLTPQIRDVTILPRPIAYASIPAPAICSGTGPNIQVTGNITDANMSFSWTRNNTVSVTGANSGTSGTIAVGGTYTITNALNNNTGVDQVVTYTITPISNGCNGTPITINVTVAPANSGYCCGKPNDLLRRSSGRFHTNRGSYRKQPVLPMATEYKWRCNLYQYSEC